MILIASNYLMQPNNNQLTSNSTNLSSWRNANTIVTYIKKEIKDGINIVKENIEYGLDGDLATLEKVSKLLNNPLIEFCSLKIINEFSVGNNNSYTVVADNQKIFTVSTIISNTRFPHEFTVGDDFFIVLETGFKNFYNEFYELDYEVASETEFEDSDTDIVNLENENIIRP